MDPYSARLEVLGSHYLGGLPERAPSGILTLKSWRLGLLMHEGPNSLL